MWFASSHRQYPQQSRDIWLIKSNHGDNTGIVFSNAQLGEFECSNLVCIIDLPSQSRTPNSRRGASFARRANFGSCSSYANRRVTFKEHCIKTSVEELTMIVACTVYNKIDSFSNFIGNYSESTNQLRFELCVSWWCGNDWLGQWVTEYTEIKTKTNENSALSVYVWI